MHTRLLFFALFGLLNQTARAQIQPRSQVSNQIHTWLTYIGDHKITDRWGVHLEGHWRRADFVASPQQLAICPGINYYASPAVIASVHFCYFENFPYGDQPVKVTFPEHRIREQLQIRSILGRFEMINRYRLEQRWIYIPVQQQDGTYKPGDAVYRNRFRPLVRFSLPLTSKTIEDGTLYLSVYEEPYVSFGKNVENNMLDQNRIYGAIGYKFSKLGRLEVGYLNQHIFKSDGIRVENNHTIQVGITSNYSFAKK